MTMEKLERRFMYLQNLEPPLHQAELCFIFREDHRDGTRDRVDGFVRDDFLPKRLGINTVQPRISLQLSQDV